MRKICRVCLELGMYNTDEVFVLFCFVLFCFVLFLFLFCFVLFSLVLFCVVLLCVVLSVLLIFENEGTAEAMISSPHLLIALLLLPSHQTNSNVIVVCQKLIFFLQILLFWIGVFPDVAFGCKHTII